MDKKHGGARPGSGRPNTGVRSMHLTLRDQDIELFRRLGNDNLSQGARLCADVMGAMIETPELIGTLFDEAFAMTISDQADFSAFLNSLTEVIRVAGISLDAGPEGLESASVDTEIETANS